MARLSYAPFPTTCVDSLSSPSAILPLEQLTFMETPLPPNGIVEIIDDDANTGEHGSSGMATQDGHAYHLTPTTPTKERMRRATVPESGNHRPQEVLPTFLFPI